MRLLPTERRDGALVCGVRQLQAASASACDCDALLQQRANGADARRTDSSDAVGSYAMARYADCHRALDQKGPDAAVQSAAAIMLAAGGGTGEWRSEREALVHLDCNHECDVVWSVGQQRACGAWFDGIDDRRATCRRGKRAAPHKRRERPPL